MGLDVGSLIFLQGRYLDFNLGYSIKNFGGSKLKAGADDVLEMKQTSELGASVVFHTNKDAIHLGADLRDIENVYKQPRYKKISHSVQCLFRNLVGVSTGVYHGSPSYGLQLDLYLMRIAFARYTREYGDRPGVDSKSKNIISLVVGGSF